MRGSSLLRRWASLGVLAGSVGLLASPSTLAQQPQGGGAGDLFQDASVPRIVDPKLAGGEVPVHYRLAGDERYRVTLRVRDASGAWVATIFSGNERGGRQVHRHLWDGSDASGGFVVPGEYQVVLQAHTSGVTQTLELPMDVVRLGITQIAAQSPTDNEWQMVYFRKDGAYEFYATPAVGEYRCTREDGEVAELDLDDGTPRPSPSIHKKTHQPALESDGSGGYRYEDDQYNYPLCYKAGESPEFVATFGATCTDGSGVAHGVHYPIPGFDLRMVGRDHQGGEWTTTEAGIVPGGTQTLSGPPLPAVQTRTKSVIEWRWQYRPAGGGVWIDVPGTSRTNHFFYTQLGEPRWAKGASGTQYSGPWVEVSDYHFQWSDGLGIECATDEQVVETLIKGFFGQVGPFAEAIEGVHYDCPSEGGDGGASHYYSFGSNSVELTRLLHRHDNGPFVNCSDCASSTSTMLAMLGVKKMKMMRLGDMTLRAIWGIGTPDYTLDLWSNGGGNGHGFSYHHIITRDGGDHCSDACLCVDEDGDPNNLPGVPGWNHDRPWSNYEALLAKADVSWSIDPLPTLR